MKSFDGRDFKSHPLRHYPSVELPEGIDYVANLLARNFHIPVFVDCWREHYAHSGQWLCKPDRSCGMELCTPILRGREGLRHLYEVVQCLSEDKHVVADHTCSLHVHLEVLDCFRSPRTKGVVSPWRLDWEPLPELSNLIGNWIKCEAVFLDAMPQHRKSGPYCQQIGTLEQVNFRKTENLQTLLNWTGHHKYVTFSSYHLKSGRRPTLEYRIADGSYCTDPEAVMNWVFLVMLFTEKAMRRSIVPFVEGDPWSGYLWLDLPEVMELMGFSEKPSSDMSKDARNFLIARISENVDTELPGMWSKESRKATREAVGYFS